MGAVRLGDWLVQRDGILLSVAIVVGEPAAVGVGGVGQPDRLCLRLDGSEHTAVGVGDGVGIAGLVAVGLRIDYGSCVAIPCIVAVGEWLSVGRYFAIAGRLAVCFS